MIPLFKNDIINRFWFDSNAAWCYCNNYQDLREKIYLVLEESNGLDSIAKHNPLTVSVTTSSICSIFFCKISYRKVIASISLAGKRPFGVSKRSIQQNYKT